MLDRDAIAGLVMTSNNKGIAGLVEPDPRTVLVGGIVDAEHISVAGGHDAPQFQGGICGGRGIRDTGGW